VIGRLVVPALAVKRRGSWAEGHDTCDSARLNSSSYILPRCIIHQSYCTVWCQVYCLVLRVL